MGILLSLPDWREREREHYWKQRIVGYVVRRDGISVELLLLQTTSSSWLERGGILGKEINRTVWAGARSLGTLAYSCRAGSRLLRCMWAGAIGLDGTKRFLWVSLIPGGKPPATRLPSVVWLSRATFIYTDADTAESLGCQVMSWASLIWLWVLQEPVLVVLHPRALISPGMVSMQKPTINIICRDTAYRHLYPFLLTPNSFPERYLAC